MSAAPPPRLVRTVVCSYTRDELPVSWLRVFHRLERAVARGRLRIRVRLYPLEELPEDVDVLVVPPELLERARAAREDARVIATTRERAAAAVDALMAELRDGREIYAERVTGDEPLIRIHRGPEIL